jgi:two-component system sensor histidine kinase KdpD
MHISRLESGIDSIPKEPVSLRDILANVMKSLNSTIIRQHFSISTSSDFPLLKVNPVLMELVIMNLIENAIKYGPNDGDIKIIATCQTNAIIIDIDDDGEGIPEPEREAVFLKFYRSKYGDSKIAGTGLGLYICKAIIEAHKGTINAISSHDGKGACMRITLPIEAAIPVSMDHEIE